MFWRPSINLTLGEEWTDEAIERATTPDLPYRVGVAVGAEVLRPSGCLGHVGLLVDVCP